MAALATIVALFLTSYIVKSDFGKFAKDYINNKYNDNSGTTAMPVSDQYSVEVAKRLCVYSYATYCDVTIDEAWDCDICLEQPQLTDITVVESYQILQNAAQGFVGYDPIYGPSIVIALAGTDPLELEDIIVDITFIPVSYDKIDKKGECIGCEVHKGFYESYMSLSGQIWSAVAQLQVKYGYDTKVAITGYSLGGAMATHCAIDAAVNYGINPTWIYTFGAPRVGNPNFAAYYRNIIPNLYRITYENDPVPHLPTQFMGFRHLPTEIHYDDQWYLYIKCDGSGEDTKCAMQHGDIGYHQISKHMQYMDYFFPKYYTQCQIDAIVEDPVDLTKKYIFKTAANAVPALNVPGDYFDDDQNINSNQKYIFNGIVIVIMLLLINLVCFMGYCIIKRNDKDSKYNKGYKVVNANSDTEL